jgi:hypothetical protein
VCGTVCVGLPVQPPPVALAGDTVCRTAGNRGGGIPWKTDLPAEPGHCRCANMFATRLRCKSVRLDRSKRAPRTSPLRGCLATLEPAFIVTGYSVAPPGTADGLQPRATVVGVGGLRVRCCKTEHSWPVQSPERSKGVGNEVWMLIRADHCARFPEERNAVRHASLWGPEDRRAITIRGASACRGTTALRPRVRHRSRLAVIPAAAATVSALTDH